MKHLHQFIAGLALTWLTLFSGIALAGSSISLALYPWVPRYDQFVQSIQTRWQQAHPDVQLKIVPQDQWDGGYSNDPTPEMDVFVFDATFLNQFRRNGYLSPLNAAEINNLGDFVPYAIQGVRQGEHYSAIPLLGCTNVLFYSKYDPPMQSVNTLNDLRGALNRCTYTSDVPPDIRGLMVKGSGSTNSYRYVELYFSQYGKFPDPNAIHDPVVIQNGREMLSIGSYLNANENSDDPYIYANWMSQGHGRAMVGYTEAMSSMSPALRSHIDFKLMPFSNTDNAPLFYSDVIGIHSKTTQRALAVELANMLASTDNVSQSIRAENGQPAQYLMPTRWSIFSQMSSDPLYWKMGKMVFDAKPTLYVLGDNAREWLETIKKPVNQALWNNYPCGCDIDAGPVPNYAQAQQVCPALCAAQGGWNGQWTNAIPGHASVCGCNTCPIK